MNHNAVWRSCDIDECAIDIEEPASHFAVEVAVVCAHALAGWCHQPVQARFDRDSSGSAAPGQETGAGERSRIFSRRLISAASISMRPAQRYTLNSRTIPRISRMRAR